MKIDKITEKTAISILNSARPRKGSYERLQKAFDMAIKALEKQIPMKPLKAYDEQVEQHWLSCPMCYKGLCWEHGFKPKYCIECGQLMDWGE